MPSLVPFVLTISPPYLFRDLVLVRSPRLLRHQRQRPAKTLDRFSMASTNPLAPKTDNESEGSLQSTADMTAFVQNLLVQMQARFQAMSEGIVVKIDEMGKKIDELEDSIKALKPVMDEDNAGKPNPGEAKPSDENEIF